MTDALARRCERAVHVMTPDGTLLSAGRASLYAMDAVGWHRFSAAFSRRPLIWLVEGTYRLVADHRQGVSRFLFRPAPGDAAAASPSAPPSAPGSASEQVRLERLKVAVCMALVGGIVLSPRLWVSSRSYPLMPVWGQVPAIPFPLDYAVVAALVALLLVAAVARAPGRSLVAALILAIGLGLQDQSRWQPWFHQYLFMLGALVLRYAGGEPGAGPGPALNSCRVIVAGVYLWSGLHKMNRSFVNEVFPWFLQGLHPVPAGLLSYVPRLALVVALLEAGTSLGLVTTRWRRPAIVLAVLTHTFILASLGPLGRNVNQVVWGWNLAMILFVILLFRGRDVPTARQILLPRNGRYHVIVLVLFALLPAFSFVYLWDAYLSFAVYSASAKRARISISDGVRDALPADVRVYVSKDESGRNLLHFGSWSSNELKVPTVPQARIYRRLGAYLCRHASAPTDVELVIEQRSMTALLRSLVRWRIEPDLRRTVHHDCRSMH